MWVPRVFSEMPSACATRALPCPASSRARTSDSRSVSMCVAAIWAMSPGICPVLGTASGMGAPDASALASLLSAFMRSQSAELSASRSISATTQP